jgi:predicted ribosome quality control (RQC) complex YloA/Tae2 family protein
MTTAGEGRGFVVDGHEVLIGRSARENEELTLRVADRRDVWLHAAGYAGSHVIIRRPEGGGDVPRHVIERAAELAAWHSKARDARGKVAVHVCPAGHVRKRRGAPPGQVQIRDYETVRVYPRGPVP